MKSDDLPRIIQFPFTLALFLVIFAALTLIWSTTICLSLFTWGSWKRNLEAFLDF
jgi:hypothetical protein